VFTTRGIWTLNLSDTGRIVVNNITVLSSSVCINADSIVVVENIIAFLASDGFKLLTGQVPSEISDLAEGSPVSVLAGNSVYTEIKSKAVVNNVSANLCTVDFLTYAANAKCAYEKNEREIIISNYSYPYSYIFSIDNKCWYKSTHRFRSFVMNYPNVFALSTGNDLVNIGTEQTSASLAIPVYLETRPIPIGPDKEVKLTRSILGGKFDIASNFYGTLLVYGSNDGSMWSLITGKEITGQYIYNITIPRLPISLRFVIFQLSGTFTKDSAVGTLRLQG
jgi:hypothetical protein